jgi:hypothetical protein
MSESLTTAFSSAEILSLYRFSMEDQTLFAQMRRPYTVIFDYLEAAGFFVHIEQRIITISITVIINADFTCDTCINTTNLQRPKTMCLHGRRKITRANFPGVIFFIASDESRVILNDLRRWSLMTVTATIR